MSDTKDNGGPAFPGFRENYEVGVRIQTAHEGMTLRDWFAGQALAGMLARNLEMPADKCGVYSYEIADAMLKARAQ